MFIGLIPADGLWMAYVVSALLLLCRSSSSDRRHGHNHGLSRVLRPLQLSDDTVSIIDYLQKIFIWWFVSFLGVYLTVTLPLSNRDYLPLSSASISELDQAVALFGGTMLVLFSAKDAWKSWKSPQCVSY